MQQLCLSAPDLVAEPPIALGLPRLFLEGLDLRRQGQGHIVEPPEIIFGGCQFQFGLVAPRIEPRGAGRLVEQQSALARLCRNQRADPPLTDERPRMRPGCGVGEQQLDIAGAGLAAIDPIGGAAATSDSAHYLDRRALVIGKGGSTRAVVDRQRDLGEIARRTAAGPGKDHIVHLAAAQPLRRGFAHHPAQRLDEIGFAAAVGPDNPSEARLDRQLGRFDKGFEPGETEAVYLHRRFFMIVGPS